MRYRVDQNRDRAKNGPFDYVVCDDWKYGEIVATCGEQKHADWLALVLHALETGEPEGLAQHLRGARALWWSEVRKAE
jgi:hypothetical protein